MTEGQKPKKKFKCGGVTASVWENSAEVMRDGNKVMSTFETIVVERTYKDKDGEWKKTNNFRKNDLPKVSLVTQKAYEFVMLDKEEDLDQIIPEEKI